MPAAYPPNDEPTSADRPDWSALSRQITLIGQAAGHLAEADDAYQVSMAAFWAGVDLSEERLLHAFIAGFAAAFLDHACVHSIWANGLLAHIPEDVR